MYLLYLYRVFYSGQGSFRSLTYGQADVAFTCLNIKKYLTKLGVKVIDNDGDWHFKQFFSSAKIHSL